MRNNRSLFRKEGIPKGSLHVDGRIMGGLSLLPLLGLAFLSLGCHQIQTARPSLMTGVGSSSGITRSVEGGEMTNEEVRRQWRQALANDPEKRDLRQEEIDHAPSAEEERFGKIKSFFRKDEDQNFASHSRFGKGERHLSSSRQFSGSSGNFRKKGESLASDELLLPLERLPQTSPNRSENLLSTTNRQVSSSPKDADGISMVGYFHSNGDMEDFVHFSATDLDEIDRKRLDLDLERSKEGDADKLVVFEEEPVSPEPLRTERDLPTLDPSINPVVTDEGAEVGKTTDDPAETSEVSPDSMKTVDLEPTLPVGWSTSDPENPDSDPPVYVGASVTWSDEDPEEDELETLLTDSISQREKTPEVAESRIQNLDPPAPLPSFDAGLPDVVTDSLKESPPTVGLIEPLPVKEWALDEPSENLSGDDPFAQGVSPVGITAPPRKTIAENKDWREAAKEAVALLQGEIDRRVKDGEICAAEEARLRLLLLSTGNIPGAAGKIAGTNPSLQRFWESECSALERLLNPPAEETEDPVAPMVAVLDDLDRGADALREKLPPVIRKSLFVKETTPFGFYEEVPAVFYPGEKAFVYYELDNVRCPATERGYEIAVLCRRELLDPRGRPVVETQEKVCLSRTASPIRDVVLNLSAELPKDLAPGIYSLRVALLDKNNPEAGPVTRVLKLTVKEDPIKEATRSEVGFATTR